MGWMILSYLRLAILWLQQSYLCITWQLPSVSGRLWEESLSRNKGGMVMTTRKALKELKKIATRMRKNMENLAVFESLCDQASELERILIAHGMESEVNEIADSIWG